MIAQAGQADAAKVEREKVMAAIPAVAGNPPARVLTVESGED